MSDDRTQPLPPDPSRGDPPTTTFTPDVSFRPPVEIPGYKLLREISRGGQGAVYEAIRTSTDRRVAIKILAGGALSNPRERARFDQEAKILGALDHPNIVRVLDRGSSADGSLYLVMDYIAGRPLTQYLADRNRPSSPTPPDPSELLRLFLKIADAVSAAHLRGIVHRDLKPANILIDEHSEPHILDFGLARAGLVRYTDEPNPEPVTITGQFLGSLPWSSPEQADGNADKIDIRSDVYSLGVILYQMLTGQFPYEVAGTMRDVLNNIILAEPPPPSQVLEARAAREQQRRVRRSISAGKLNPVIDAIVLKALAKRREDRYQSAGELARDIANYLSGRPTLAAGSAPRRLPEPWVLVSAAVALTLIVSALGVAHYIRSTTPRLPGNKASVANTPPTVTPTQSVARRSVVPDSPVVPVNRPRQFRTVDGEVDAASPDAQPIWRDPLRPRFRRTASTRPGDVPADDALFPYPPPPRRRAADTQPFNPDELPPPPEEDPAYAQQRRPVRPGDPTPEADPRRLRRPYPPPPEDDPLGLGPAGRRERDADREPAGEQPRRGPREPGDVGANGNAADADRPPPPPDNAAGGQRRQGPRRPGPPDGEDRRPPPPPDEPSR